MPPDIFQASNGSAMVRSINIGKMALCWQIEWLSKAWSEQIKKQKVSRFSIARKLRNFWVIPAYLSYATVQPFHITNHSDTVTKMADTHKSIEYSALTELVDHSLRWVPETNRSLNYNTLRFSKSGRIFEKVGSWINVNSFGEGSSSQVRQIRKW